MKAMYIGKTPILKSSEKFPIVDGYIPDPSNGKVYEIEAVHPNTCSNHPKMAEYVIVIRIYNIMRVSWTTIGYKTLDNFIKNWDFNVDPSVVAVGQDINELNTPISIQFPSID